MNNYVKLQRPVFKHDCRVCVFIGTTLDEHGQAHDWYTCERAGMSSVLARYANDEASYWSMDARAILEERNLMVSYEKYQQLLVNEKLIIARFMLSLKEKS